MSHTVAIKIIGVRQSPAETNQTLMEGYVLIDRGGQWSLRQSRGSGESFIETNFEYESILDILPWITDQLKGFTVSVQANGTFSDVFIDMKKVGLVKMAGFKYTETSPEISYQEVLVNLDDEPPQSALTEAEAAAVMVTAIDIVNAAKAALAIK